MENIQSMILNPDPARVIEGLRDTGYDFNTAIADLVDNSIAAHASKIKIYIDNDINCNVTLYIADNGEGMNLDGLMNAMRYGSARRQDASSLGKFGLGLKTASTAFCRSLSVLSKSENSNYNKVQWDLDEVCKRNAWELLAPNYTEDEIDFLESVTEGKSGTLVIWEKVDRLMRDYKNKDSQDKRLDKVIKSLKFHISMVFQRFIDPNNGYTNCAIEINDELLKPWDPFCSSEDKTQVLAEQKVEVQINDNTKTSFYLKAYLLPRVEDFSSPEAKSIAKVSNDFEGFYVYRENRLIHYGDWLGMFINDPHISLLRVDFSFTHELDEAFNVDIKKSRVTLDDGIFDYIKKTFMPAPRKCAEDLYRKGQSKDVKKDADKKDAHQGSNNNIDEKASKVEQSKVTVNNPQTGEVTVNNKQGSFKTIIKIIDQDDKKQCRVIPVDTIDSNMLWQPTISNGKHAVSINQSHEYYKKVYSPVIDNSVLITGMDALLWALSEAELSTYNDETKEQYEDMRIQVSNILKKLVKDLPDPDIEDTIEETE